MELSTLAEQIVEVFGEPTAANARQSGRYGCVMDVRVRSEYVADCARMIWETERNLMVSVIDADGETVVLEVYPYD